MKNKRKNNVSFMQNLKSVIGKVREKDEMELKSPVRIQRQKMSFSRIVSRHSPDKLLLDAVHV